MLAIWSLVPLPFLKPAWTGSSWFTYCWSLAWRILNIALLAWEMSAVVWIQEDKSNSSKPWSSIFKLNDTPRGGRTVSSHCQETEEWEVSQWLRWSSHSLAYEFTQITKTSHTIFRGRSTWPLQWPTPCRVCFSPNLNKSTSYLSLCLQLNFCNEISRTWASLGPEARQHGFWPGSSPGRDELKDGRKMQWEKHAKESPS